MSSRHDEQSDNARCRTARRGAPRCTGVRRHGWRCASLLTTGWGLIASTANADTMVTLKTGERLKVDQVHYDATTVRFVHPVLGTVRAPRDQVRVHHGDGSVDAEIAETAAGMMQDEPAQKKDEDWKLTFTLGGSISDGNSETASLTAQFKAMRETEQMKTLIDAGYFYASTGGDRSQNAFTTGIRNDWLNPGSKWFYFADARFDYDEFQSWEERIQGHVGVGYRLVEPPKWTVNLLGGIGAVKEFGSDNEDVRPEALFGVEGKWDIAEKHAITFSSIVYPDLSDIGEYRWVNTAGWTYLLDAEHQLSLTAGVHDEYQSKVDPGRKHNDLRAFVGLQLDF